MGSPEETITLSNIKELFKKSEDVVFQAVAFNNVKVHFIKCDAMVDQQLLYNVVLPTIEKLLQQSEDGMIDQKKIEQLPIPPIQQIKNKEDLITFVYTGKVLIYFEQSHLLYCCDTVKKPNRSPEDTNLESIVKGPRDNFIEDLPTNIALIRKRFPSNSLCVEKVEIGRRTKTQVAILYVEDIANKGILTELKGHLQAIDTDIVVSGDALMEFINKKNRFLPATNYTGRPDFAIQSLVRGRFIVMVDGTAYGVITPINFLQLFKSGEDFENTITFSSFERLIRLVGAVIGVTLPAFWLALTIFHQNQLPLQLLATVVIANRGLPFPAVLEMLFLLFMFEMFREVGLRLPTTLGGTFTVVGGLIIGDAVIRSGITSPAMVVVIAISTIATHTIVNQSLVSMLSILRILFILFSAFFGLFGFFICFYGVILYLANIRIFGTPYLNISADLSWDTIKKSLIRQPKSSYKKRPNMLDPQDQSRMSKGNSNDETH